MASSDERAVIRERLQQLMNRVPASVNSGTYDTAVRYKDAVKRAQKALANTRLDARGLLAYVVELEGFGK